MKKQLKLPDFLSVSRFDKWNCLNQDKSLSSKIKSLEAITLETERTLKELTPDEFNNFYAQATSLLVEEELPVILVEYKNKIWGYSSFSAKTIGEVADIEEIFKTNNMQMVLKSIIRPVKELHSEFEWELLGEDDDGDPVKVVRVDDVSSQIKNIELEDYDANKQPDNAYFSAFPFHVYSSLVGFMLGTGLPFILASQGCSLKDQEAMKEAVKKFVEAEVSLRQSLILRRLTS